MTPKSLIALAICASTLGVPALAEPFCAPMLDADALERRYQRLAPIYNSTETGWIFASDQLDYRYVLNRTEAELLAQLVDELAARGTQLAMLVAPPRPVVAGQAVLDATAGAAGAHDLDAQAEAFNDMIAQFQSAGAVAPNLLDVALSEPEFAQSYYFHRDTHWTNLGAAHSALALAAVLEPGQPPAFAPSALDVVEMAAERGSLSRIVEATCGNAPAPEQSALFDYTPVLPGSGGLLGDGDEGRAAVLLGTSYSDRYGRDQYQSADALSAALQRPIVNRSVSGGGMVGPFETYILTGAYAEERPDLLIWEFPYTYQLNEAGLRMLLGALQADGPLATAGTITPDGDDASFEVSADMAASDLLALRMVDGATRDMVVRLTFADGDTARLRLRRKSRMEEVAILDTWWIDLRGFDSDMVSFTLELRGNHDLNRIEVLTSAVSG